jgi:hypothetical protein
MKVYLKRDWVYIAPKEKQYKFSFCVLPSCKTGNVIETKSEPEFWKLFDTQPEAMQYLKSINKIK